MKTERKTTLLKSWQQVVGTVLAVLLAAGLGAVQAYGSCIAIDDIPLDTQETKAPGIVMIIVDDSGSMDWTTICKGYSNGAFDGKYEYVFANPGDNNYTTGTTYGSVLEGSSDANKWQSQWAGHNRLYYDPAAVYPPWPGYVNADMNTPRSNPANATPTLNLNATYHDFGSGSGELTSEDILGAGGVIVDNKVTLMPELIMDNKGPVGATKGSFSTAGSSSGAWGTSSASSDYDDDYLYSANANKWDVAAWQYTDLMAGKYDVYVWYVASSNRGNSVNYKVYDAGGTEMASRSFDQEYNGGKWNLLASNISLSGSAKVELRHYCTSTYNNRACADAVKLVPKFSNADVSFSAGTGWSSTTTAIDYGDDYLYSSDGDRTYTASWTASNLDSSKDYNVYAWWVNNSSRSNDVHYKIYDDASEVADTSVDQEYNGGKWVQIAEAVTFSSGTGKVEIDQYGGNSSFCADAVAFMPNIGVSAPKVIRAHYYTAKKEDDGTITGVYLVNLDGGFKYFKVKDLDNDGNVDGAEELESLTPDEAATAGIVTGRTYTEERQNFANWYSYYRRREFTAKNALARMLEDMQGIYVGIHCLNSGLKSAIQPVRVTLNGTLFDESPSLLTTLYSINSNSGTPLRTALNNIGQYFMGDYGKPAVADMPEGSFSEDSYPFFTADAGGTCQQAFTILTTDGYWNDTFYCTDHDGDGYANTLADVAMYYYNTDLNTSLNNDVPISSRDMANWQHMVTYSLSFGLDGTKSQSDYPDCSSAGGCPTWPQPFADGPTTIDDLWHASVNGHGKYVNAASPQELLNALAELRQDIESRLGSAAALATNSIQRQVGTVVYQGTYNTAGWTGELSALPVNVRTGQVSDPLWRASNHIPSWETRKIFSYNGSSGIEFFYSNLASAQIAQLSASGYDPEKLVNFIRGDTSNSLTYGGSFRNRIHPMGDIIHSSPYYYKGTVYIGANDGMLHAVDAATGQEKFCYVPNIVYDHLSDLAVPGYTHKYYVDLTPVVGRVDGRDVLVCGLGKGGKGYFALDVTNSSEPTVLWEFAGDPDLGYSFSQPAIVQTQDPDNPHVMVFGNGYDSTNGSAVLFIVNPNTGALIKKLYTNTTGCNGLSSPALVDVDGDGVVESAYVGDLQGNMWKFDLRKTAADWKVYYTYGTTPMPLVTVRNKDGDIQPITVAPEVMADCSQSNFARLGQGVMVIFGTGQYLNASDFDDATVQSFYGIWDWGNLWENKDGYDQARGKFLGTIFTDRKLSAFPSKYLLEQTITEITATIEIDGETVVDDSWLKHSDNPIFWYNPLDNSGDHLGWFFDLPVPGERGIREPMLRMGVAVLISVIPSSSPCEAGGSSVLYQVDGCTGGLPHEPQFDVNQDGKIDDEDLVDGEPPSGKKFDQMLFEPIEIVDQLYLSDSQGDVNRLVVPPNTMGMQYWRIIE